MAFYQPHAFFSCTAAMTLLLREIQERSVLKFISSSLVSFVSHQRLVESSLCLRSQTDLEFFYCEKMKLFYSRSDYCLLKVKLVAALTGTTVDVEEKSHDELVALDASAKTLLLEVDGQYISQHLTILRYLAEHSSKAKELLLEDVERAQIDQWLEFSWEELGK